MKTLTLSQKFGRLRARLQDQEWRRYGALLLFGKLMGVALLFTGVMFYNPSLLGLEHTRPIPRSRATTS